MWRTNGDSWLQWNEELKNYGCGRRVKKQLRANGSGIHLANLIQFVYFIEKNPICTNRIWYSVGFRIRVPLQIVKQKHFIWCVDVSRLYTNQTTSANQQFLDETLAETHRSDRHKRHYTSTRRSHGIFPQSNQNNSPY